LYLFICGIIGEIRTIKRQINQIIPQLFSIRPTLNITSTGLLSRKNYTTVFRPASTAESGQERETLSMRNFYEWLGGFVDAEGSFYIAISRSCAFRFQINLHKDDINVLYYIHKTLGFGEVRSYRNFSSFTVTRLKDIALLLKIFDQYPLQGSKWLKAVSLLNDKKYYHYPLKDCSNCRAQYIVLTNNVHCLLISGDLVVYNLFISQLLFTKAKPSILNAFVQFSN